MHRIWLCFFLVAVELCVRVQSEVFTSTTHLTQIFNTEVELAKELEIYLKEKYEQLDHVKKFLDVIKDEISQAQGKEEQYFGNPINTYLFIKHLTLEWDQIKEMVSSGKIIGDQWLFPSPEDYTGTVTGLLRLQDTYQLNTSELINGEISLNFPSKKLTTDECYDIGRIAYSNGDFYHALMWMQEALDCLDRENNNASISKNDVLDHLVNATFQQGNIEHALALTEEMLAIDPDHVRAKDNKIYYESLIKNQTLAEEHQEGDLDLSDNSSSTVDNLEQCSVQNNGSSNKNYQVKNQRPGGQAGVYEVYEKLCRQKDAQLSEKRQATLFCRYRHNNHPYLIIGPVKEEQLLDEPAVFLFHDVLSDADIEEIKALVLPKLQRALISNPATNTLTPAEYRISKSAWLNDQDSPVVARFSRLINALTNLSMETAEPLQVVNYGVGGHYVPHFDFYGTTDTAFIPPNMGNRIATWLTYMSNVEWGGATVFPFFDGHIMPKKGSAAFWYNLHASGEGDHRTLHAGCPVLIGNKWVANKWIHERGQEFRRRCSLDSKV